MRQDQWNKVQDLEQCLSDLEGFEEEFVGDMVARGEGYNLSPKQADKIDQIWNRHCGTIADDFGGDDDDEEYVDWRKL